MFLFLYNIIDNLLKNNYNLKKKLNHMEIFDNILYVT